MKPLAIVTGVGPGTGASLARKFAAGGYRVAMLARDAARLDALADELKDAVAVAVDVSDAKALLAALDDLVARFGTPKVVVHNAVGGAFGNFLDIDPSVLEQNFATNVVALHHLARAVVPKMIEAGGGSLIVTGNTSALRGKAHFAGFAPTKAAQRILAEAIAREVGPKGVHVAYLVIDAVIDVPWTRERWKDAPDDFFIAPDDIAAEVFHLAHQPKSAWSFLSEVRPFRETW
ncbi:SDR family NAD(P)-dependent oxidoreductase [Phenylobacterium sp.]|jgi:NAD(P)-dependent dehydrogenase (short-subunit alcohol dehydrogenase family)|uniref:SDR family NAD(P)-dependent oxidoreductase n=1 Tax=Phenylobacterium sp. TaxID=1871053 RepID=UPI0035AF244D